MWKNILFVVWQNLLLSSPLYGCCYHIMFAIIINIVYTNIILTIYGCNNNISSLNLEFKFQFQSFSLWTENIVHLLNDKPNILISISSSFKYRKKNIIQRQTKIRKRIIIYIQKLTHLDKIFFKKTFSLLTLNHKFLHSFLIIIFIRKTKTKSFC